LNFIAKTISGLEEVLAEELRQLGAQDVEILNRAVGFSGDQRLMYKANYCCRTALRILKPIFSFQLADEDDLYGHIHDHPWEEIMDVAQTLAIDAVVSESELTHSHYVALRTKDAICDHFREINNGRRPSVDVDDPDFRINIHIFGNECDVSLDSSGISLHKRGYRASNAEAPMSEVLAAGLILMSGWDRKSTFIDPMCGSGTLLIEAALIANNFPAGLYRKSFGFMRWNDFSRELWEEVVAEAQSQEIEFDHPIIGNDISSRNLGAARANLKSARLHKDIQLQHGPFSELLPPPGEPGIIIINPPYGERIKTNDIIGLYKEIGNALKRNFTGYKAWVISSDHYALKSVGLKAFQKSTVWNGPLECKFAGFDLYEGSRKIRIESDLDESSVESPIPSSENTDPAESTGSSSSPQPRKPFGKDQQDRPFSRESKSNRDSRNDDRPFRRDDRPRRESRNEDRPFRRDDKPRRESRSEDRPFRREDRPHRENRNEDRPFRREDKPRGESRNEDRPFRRDDKPRRENRSEDRPFRREDRPHRENRNEDRPFPREDRPHRENRNEDRPFRREDRPHRESRNEDRPFRREDRPHRENRNEERPSRREDRPSREKRSDPGFRKTDRTDRPFKKEDSNTRFNREEGKPLSPGRRNAGTNPEPRKEIELYQPQNRFEKPEKTFRRKDGKVNEGNPSGKKEKDPKPKRPRKDKNNE